MKEYTEKEKRTAAALQDLIEKEGGWTRITMKDDGQEIDISYCFGGKYKANFPPYYGDGDDGLGKELIYKPLDKWFNNLFEVAEFLLKKGWQQKWN